MSATTLTGLDLIEIASPCPASWDAMTGDERVRFCSQCKLNVYNLSEMNREEAERLVRDREGRTCVQFYRRHDGTVLTKDCPVGVTALRQRLFRAVAAIAGLLVALVGGTLFGGALERRFGVNFATPFQTFAHWIDPRPPVVGGMMFLPPGAFNKSPTNLVAQAAETPRLDPTEVQKMEIQRRLER